jgi:hypothetical protein
MVEISLVIMLIVGMGKIARADDKSPTLWGAIALGITLLCAHFVHFLYARVLLAGILSFGAMWASNVIADK